MAIKQLPSSVSMGDHQFFPQDEYGRLVGPDGIDLGHPDVPSWYRPPEKALTVAEQANRLRIVNGVRIILPQGVTLAENAITDAQKNALIEQFLSHCTGRGRQVLEGADHPFEIKISHAVPVGDQVHLAGAISGDVKLLSLRFDLKDLLIFTFELPKELVNFEGEPETLAQISARLVVEFRDSALAALGSSRDGRPKKPSGYERKIDALAAEAGPDAVASLQRQKENAQRLDQDILSGLVKVPPINVGGTDVEVFEIDKSGSGKVSANLPAFFNAVVETLRRRDEGLTIEIPAIVALAIGNAVNTGFYDSKAFMEGLFGETLQAKLLETGFEVEIEVHEVFAVDIRELTDEELLEVDPPDYVLDIKISSGAAEPISYQ